MAIASCPHRLIAVDEEFAVRAGRKAVSGIVFAKHLPVNRAYVPTAAEPQTLSVSVANPDILPSFGLASIWREGIRNHAHPPVCADCCGEERMTVDKVNAVWIVRIRSELIGTVEREDLPRGIDFRDCRTLEISQRVRCRIPDTASSVSAMPDMKMAASPSGVGKCSKR